MNDSYGTVSSNRHAALEQSFSATSMPLDELSSVLEREVDCYKDLLETARSEQKAIIHGKLNELKLAIEAEENLIASSRALDEVRRNIVALIARQIGCCGTDLSLREIIEKVDPKHKGRLNSLRDELLGITKSLELVNRGNAQLIKSSVDFINETMWILLQTKNEKDTVYDSTGRDQKNSNRQVLVDKIG